MVACPHAAARAAPPVLIHSVVWLAVAGACVTSLSLHAGFAIDVIKDRGALAHVVEDDVVENTLRLQFLQGLTSVRWKKGLSGVAWEVSSLFISRTPIGTEQVC